MDERTDFSEEVNWMTACSPDTHKLSHGGQEVLEMNYRKHIPRWHSHSKTEKRISTSPRKKDDLRTGGMALQVRELLLKQEDLSSDLSPTGCACVWSRTVERRQEISELAGFPAEPRQWVPASIRGSVSDKGSANKEHRRDHYFSFFLSKYLSLSLRYLNMKNVIDFFF